MRRIRALIMGLMSTVLLGGALGGATFALFSASAASEGAALTAGTLEISASQSTAWSADVGNLAPGDVSSREITVANTGSLRLAYVATASNKGPIFSGDTPATVQIANAFGILSPGESATMTLTVALPLEANNDYQKRKGETTITIRAYQTKNVTAKPAEAVLTQDNTPLFDLLWDVYEIRDSDGNTIDLEYADISEIYTRLPDGLIVRGGFGRWLQFPNSAPDGSYLFVVLTRDGNVYHFTIDHVAN